MQSDARVAQRPPKIIEEIKTPLIHIIRNSIDHGIETPEERIALNKPETGKIILSAKQSNNKVIIKIIDDGRGININKIKEKAVSKGFLTPEELSHMTDNQIMELIFTPGFSTGEVITNISGRGIGLDVVQSKISELNGKVKVLSELNKGCCVQIELPTTMAIMKVFIVKTGSEIYAIPIDTVHIRVHDLEDLEVNLKLAKNLGFEGMLILNPKELPLCHQYFSPTEDEIAWAREMVELAEEAVREGKGVAVKDNKFIGPPMLKMAKNIIAKHDKISAGIRYDI